MNSGTRMLAKNTSSASGYICEASSSSTPPRMVLGCAGPELDHREHRVDIGRDVKDGGADHEGPGAHDAVGLALVHGRAAARAPAVALGGHADQAAVLAADGAGPEVERRHFGQRRMRLAAPFDLLPHGMGIERGFGPHDDDGEQAQRVDRGAEFDGDQVAELGVGHEHAQQQHLEHGPGAHAARHQEYAAQVGRQPAHLEADQDIDRADELDERRDRRGEGDRQRKRPQAAIDQLDRPRFQRRLVHDAGGRNLHQHGEPQHGEQHQGGAGERQVTVQRIGAGLPQHGAAAHAVGAHVGLERRHDLELAAAGTFAKLRPGHGLRGRSGAHRQPEVTLVKTAPSESRVACTEKGRRI